jgi:hypothetical protein
VHRTVLQLHDWTPNSSFDEQTMNFFVLQNGVEAVVKTTVKRKKASGTCLEHTGFYIWFPSGILLPAKPVISTVPSI